MKNNQANGLNRAKNRREILLTIQMVILLAVCHLAHSAEIAYKIIKDENETLTLEISTDGAAGTERGLLVIEQETNPDGTGTKQRFLIEWAFNGPGKVTKSIPCRIKSMSTAGLEIEERASLMHIGFYEWRGGMSSAYELAKNYLIDRRARK
jgi:hypothetical protein